MLTVVGQADLKFDGKYIGQKVLDGIDVQKYYNIAKESPEEFAHFLLKFSDRVVTTLAVTVDDIEAQMREQIDGVEFIDLEADIANPEDPRMSMSESFNKLPNL